MEKIKGKHLKSAVFFLCISYTVSAQSKSGMENYNMISSEKTYTWMPVVHYQSNSGFYSELRYNYEDERTVSLYAGRKIFTGYKKQIELVPMAGFSVGKFSGFSLALKADIETDALYISAETQYSLSFVRTAPGFFFNWSEAGLNIGNNFFAGSALQTTIKTGSIEFHPGIMAGISLGNITVPVYLFKPTSYDKWLQVGLNYKHNFKKNKK